MSRWTKIALGVLAIWAAVSLIFLPGLRQRIERLARPQPSEERVRREVTRAPVVTPRDAKVKATMFWAAGRGDAVAPVDVELALSSDPVERAKQLVETLILRPPTEPLRTLPAECTLVEFYLLPDGTAIADFSGALATATPAGILSEQLALDSITRTLAANVPAIQRLKILIQGQEVDTLAGHVDLTEFFPLRPPPRAPAPPPPGRTTTTTARQWRSL